MALMAASFLSFGAAGNGSPVARHFTITSSFTNMFDQARSISSGDI